MNNHYLFLDIDGVLNGHNWHADAQSNLILPECVNNLNTILGVCEPRVILSSAWRYLIHRGAMTLGGFAVMLRSHGVDSSISELLLHVTVSDEQIPTRGEQVRDWLSRFGVGDYRAVILDDAPTDGPVPMCFKPVERLLVKTDGKVGLTKENVDEVIRRFWR